MVLLYDLSGQFWMTQIGLVRVGTEQIGDQMF